MPEGKVAVITGAGGGIGKSVALRLARDGASIVAADVSAEAAGATAEEVRALARPAIDVRVDVRELPQVQAMVDAAVERFGRVDILVACAGIAQQRRMLDISEVEWDRVFDINTKGLFFTLQLVARQMVRQGGGRIVNIASGSARGPRPLHVHYAASKIAVISITWSAAAALASHGITVNAVCPGIVATPMWDQIDRDMNAEFGVPLGEFRQQRLQHVPLGRIQTPEDVASVVAFLVSEDASYITGQSLNADGGLNMQ